MVWGRNWGWRNRNHGGGGGGKKKAKSKPKSRRGAWAMPSSMSSMGNYMYNDSDHLDILGALGTLNMPTFSYADEDDEMDTTDLEVPDDTGAGDVNIGSLRGNIVGIKYYRGSVNSGEMINLQREPNNAYDPNAVKVVNVDGIQVGHIKRELAHPLSYLMDKNLVRIEGVVPSANTSLASMPVELTFWAQPADKQTILDKLRYSGFYLTAAPTPGSSSSSHIGGAYNTPVRTHLNEAQLKNQLDKLFENLDEKDKTKCMEPSPAIATKLFPHQKQALNWMVQRENSYKLPPFWEEPKKGEFYNTLTVFTSTRRPRPVRGGILADDMGLGKTLEMIALIMTNFVDKQPLAEAVPGKVRPSRLAKEERRRMYRKLGKKMPAERRNKRVKLTQPTPSQSAPSCSQSEAPKKPGPSQSRNEAPKKPGYEAGCSLPTDEVEEDLSETLSESSDDCDMMDNAHEKDDPNFSPSVKKIKKSKGMPSPNILHRPRRSVPTTKYVINSESETDEEDQLPVPPPTKYAISSDSDTEVDGKLPVPPPKKYVISSDSETDEEDQLPVRPPSKKYVISSDSETDVEEEFPVLSPTKCEISSDSAIEEEDDLPVLSPKTKGKAPTKKSARKFTTRTSFGKGPVYVDKPFVGGRCFGKSRNSSGAQAEEPILIPDDLPTFSNPPRISRRVFVKKDPEEGYTCGNIGTPGNYTPRQRNQSWRTGNLNNDFGIATEVTVETSPDRQANETSNPVYMDCDFQGGVVSDEETITTSPDRPEGTGQEMKMETNDAVPRFSRALPENVRNRLLPSSSYQVPSWSLGNPDGPEVLPQPMLAITASPPMLCIMPPLPPSQTEPSQDIPHSFTDSAEEDPASRLTHPNEDLAPNLPEGAAFVDDPNADVPTEKTPESQNQAQTLTSSSATDLLTKGTMSGPNLLNGMEPEFQSSVTNVVKAGGIAIAVNVSVKVVKDPNEKAPVSKKVIAEQVVQHAKEATESVCQSVLNDYAGDHSCDGTESVTAALRTPIKDVMDKSAEKEKGSPVERPSTPYSDVGAFFQMFSGGPATPEKAEAGVPKAMPSPNVKSRPRRASKKPTRYALSASEGENEASGEEWGSDNKKKATKRKLPGKENAKTPAKKRQKSGPAKKASAKSSGTKSAQSEPAQDTVPAASTPMVPNLSGATAQTASSATTPAHSKQTPPASSVFATSCVDQTAAQADQALSSSLPNLNESTPSQVNKTTATSQPESAAATVKPDPDWLKNQVKITKIKAEKLKTEIAAKSAIKGSDPDWLTNQTKIKAEKMKIETASKSAKKRGKDDPDWLMEQMRAKLEKVEAEEETISPSRPISVKLKRFTPKASDPLLPTLPSFAKVSTKQEQVISDDDDLPDLDLLAAADAPQSTSDRKPMKMENKPVIRKGKAKRKSKNVKVYDSDSDILPDLDDVAPSMSGCEDIPDNMNSIADFDPVQRCGALTGRTETDKPRGTLIICPVSVISNWVEQFDDHVHENYHIALYTYYGPSRIRNVAKLAKYDVVITTYSTLTSDSKSKSNPMKTVPWLRLVLDEGHMIRNPNAQQTKAVLELKAERKWVLTGTPIQNSMKDFYSLVNFLQISPFTDKEWWLRTIERPLGHGSEAALKRVQLLMASIAMRRTKTQKVDGKPLVNLPKKDIFIEHVEFSDEERKIYDHMHDEGKLIVSKYFRQGTLLRHYGQILAIICRLRQLCCHPFLLKKAVSMLDLDATLPAVAAHAGADGMSEETRRNLIETLLNVLSSGADEECSICLDRLKSAVITPCAHVYCRQCIEAVITNEGAGALCPLCRGNISRDRLTDVPPEGALDDDVNVTTGDWHSSSKIDALMKALVDLREQDPTIKSMVVSQFTSFLSVIETPLTANGFKFVRFDGRMSQKQRATAIEVFSDTFPDSPTIFLLSLKAGGVGVNLTAASRVFMMDPAWNPAAEDQCYDRCHRLGQTRDVVVTRFLVEDSVEQRMLDLQEKKRSLMAGAFGKKPTADERRTARIRDIRNLMDI